MQNYSEVKRVLTQRFSPHERELACQCEFRNRKRNKGESVSDYGYALRRLGQKAFPLMPSSALESCIIDQFVHGLGNFELQNHVHFLHPQTLDQAISSAVEYCALLGSLNKISKPSDSEIILNIQSLSENVVSSLRPTNMKTDCTLEDLQQMLSSLLDQKLEQKFTEKMSVFQNRNAENTSCVRQRSPSRSRMSQFDQSRTSTLGNDYSKRSGSPRRDLNTRADGLRNSNSAPRNIFCDYCNQKGHVESRCFAKFGKGNVQKQSEN